MSPTRSHRSSALSILLLVLLVGCGAEATSDGVRASSASPPESGPPSSGGTPADPSGAGSGAGDSQPTVVFLGNSLTAGLGVAPNEAFPALIQRRVESAGLEYRVVNAGISGETTAGGLRRIDWVLDPPPSVLVLALGANDALRGSPPDTVKANLQRIIDRTRDLAPEAAIVVAGMLAPPNMGETYADAFREVFPELAAANGATLVPFLLEGVAADPELNQTDGIHPNAAGHEIMAETVWASLRPVLERRP